MNIKFKLFLPFLTLLLIVTLFSFKLIFNKSTDSVIKLKNEELLFHKTVSIFTENEVKFKQNNKYIILNFFSTNCEQCINKLSELEHLNKKGIKIYGIMVGENKNNLTTLLNKFGNCFEDILMINYKTYKNIGYNKLPVTIILKDNKIVYKFEDNLKYQLIEKIILNEDRN
ncbi:redoxin domain-containing protein [Rickettsiales endosymbiont of Trichoplax sp. H2]|uniref:redoxin domain-containing protein n=1 Tax=Rickettsiales endosymbiont of Trichoplax sp. H2 TaxID=2021221 RepID=UPI0012B2C3E9|nr:redoxin domain-containing protein [Rickettsiales endosymbiont of Trichoplax sp. H2]MSO13223.1 Thiol:disulfide interchange protein DsbE [Rickettsiales endosymbiont of Trichoplax sp. H2]